MLSEFFQASTGVPVPGFRTIEIWRPDDVREVSFYTDDSGILLIGFSPTLDTRDWMIDFNILRETVTLNGLRISVHSGFWSEYQTMRLKVLQVLAQVKPTVVYISGFSKGAAHATLCHLDILTSGAQVAVHTLAFGSPRLFGWWTASKLSKIYKDSGHLFQRFTLSGDPVSRVPFGWWGFRHVGSELVADGPEWWFPGDIKVHNPGHYLSRIEALKA